MIQEPLKKKRGPLTHIGTAILFLAVIAAIWYAIPKKQAPAGSLRFYTDDDGATWFTDSVNKIPPFRHNGKEAVLARVYQTTDGKPFVAYLEKFNEETRQRLDAKTTDAPAPHAGVAMVKNTGPHASGLLVKKPGAGAWIPEEDPAAKAVRTFSAPDGSKDSLPATPE